MKRKMRLVAFAQHQEKGQVMHLEKKHRKQNKSGKKLTENTIQENSLIPS
ncbi:hypothetical protein Sjap_005066 [Stephania japonica]|uniref:Uncharacterized protein n=1 Tax=Stephania japonica TaxID=461633 RepID=A0AAP0PHI9_9MAGN